MAFTPEQQVQLETALEARFFPYISEMPDKPQWSPVQQRTSRLSRSLAAYSVARLAEMPDLTGAEAVVDGDEDNGLDAIHYDRAAKRLYLVQSKFKRGNPDSEEVLKFVTGVRDLREENYLNFNPAVQLKKAEIETALSTPGVQLCLVFCHLGEGVLNHPARFLNDFILELRREHISAELLDLKGETLYRHLLEDQAPPRVIADLRLEHVAQTPAGQGSRVLYGQVSVLQLAELHAQHGRALFSQNIRDHLGSSGVNEAIAHTLTKTPELFLHFNNGITVVCQHIRNSSRGVFSLEDMSIINGAQTVGTIARVAQGQDLTTSSARVLVTVIEAEGRPENFQRDVTRARNTQNAIKSADFATHDPVQEKLRCELALLGVRYVYKPGEAPLEPHLTSHQVSLALATLASTAEDAVSSQRPKDLTDPDKEIYRRLFREKLRDLRASKVCRMVEIYRTLEVQARASALAFPINSLERKVFRQLVPLLIWLVGRTGQVLKGEGPRLEQEEHTALSRELERVTNMALQRLDELRTPFGFKPSETTERLPTAVDVIPFARDLETLLLKSSSP